MRFGFTTTLLLAATLAATDARADASSWLFVGGGAARLEHASGAESMPRLMQLDLGMGTSPENAIVLGGLLRSSTYFEEGTDLGLAARAASGGYARGSWGVALDVGAAQRFWGRETTALAVNLSAGAPWGLVLGLGGAFAPDSVRTFGLVVGIDWARFTVHRRSGSDWWPNYRLPLGGERATASR